VEGLAQQAVELLKQGAQAATRALGPDDPLVAQDLDRLGSALLDAGRPAEAATQHRLALEINKAALGADHPHVATSLTHLGQALDANGQSTQALAALEQALALRTRRADQPAALAHTRIALAKVLWRQPAQHERARALAQDAAQGSREESADRRDAVAWLETHRGP
jgi:tetratricopeptide (TPR) repeat protein